MQPHACWRCVTLTLYIHVVYACCMHVVCNMHAFGTVCMYVTCVQHAGNVGCMFHSICMHIACFQHACKICRLLRTTCTVNAGCMHTTCTLHGHYKGQRSLTYAFSCQKGEKCPCQCRPRLFYSLIVCALHSQITTVLLIIGLQQTHSVMHTDSSLKQQHYQDSYVHQVQNSMKQLYLTHTLNFIFYKSF